MEERKRRTGEENRRKKGVQRERRECERGKTEKSERVTEEREIITLINLSTRPTRSILRTRTILITEGENLVSAVPSGRLNSTMISTIATSRIRKSKMFHLLRK